MKQFIADDINDIYRQVAKEIVNNGEERFVRGFKTKELSEECCIILENPENSVVTLPARHQDQRVYKYLEGEFSWFLSGNLSLEPIQPYAKFWNKLANPDFTINSNYGYYAFIQKTPEEGKSQFDWCVAKLKADPNTRQAIININQPMHKYLDNKDFCCTIAMHFLYRKGKLDCIVWMRSNDFIFGSTYNFPWFTYMQRRVAEAVGMEVGRYVHMVSTLHVYEPHYAMLEEMANYNPNPEERIEHNIKAGLIRDQWKDFTDGKITEFGDSAWKIHSGLN